jgi:hypothetical protein
MTTYHKDTYATAVITDHRNGTATLVIRTINGVKAHNKTHASRKAALAAWYRFCK